MRTFVARVSVAVFPAFEMTTVALVCIRLSRSPSQQRDNERNEGGNISPLDRRRRTNDLILQQDLLSTVDQSNTSVDRPEKKRVSLRIRDESMRKRTDVALYIGVMSVVR